MVNPDLTMVEIETITLSLKGEDLEHLTTTKGTTSRTEILTTKIISRSQDTTTILKMVKAKPMEEGNLEEEMTELTTDSTAEERLDTMMGAKEEEEDSLEKVE